MSANIISFSSDFGNKDTYTGSVKGVLLALNANCKVIDVTHEISPFNTQQAAFRLLSYYSFFPKNTVHLVVIDPGVGGSRAPLIIHTTNYFFVGPDNGCFSYILQREAHTLYKIDPARIAFYTGQSEISQVFHARDVFGPAAALLSRGVRPEKLAELYSSDMVNQPFPADFSSKKNAVRILDIDYFGNIITELTTSEFERLGKPKLDFIQIKDNIIKKISGTYAEVKQGELLALWGSSGFLEIAVNQGNAAAKLGCSCPKDTVKINWMSEERN